MGAINSPQNCYLLSRGLKTFELRMQRHNENGQPSPSSWPAIRAIEKVYYPGPASRTRTTTSPASTMRGFGGLVTFLVKDADWRATADIVDAVTHPAHRPEPGRRRVAHRAAAGDELLPVHARRPPHVRHPRQHDPPVCGIENADDLIADLSQALDATV